MRDAVRSRYIRTNPLDGVKPPKAPRQEKDVLSPEDVRNLLDTAEGGSYEGIIVLGATVGLRVGKHSRYDVMMWILPKAQSP